MRTLKVVLAFNAATGEHAEHGERLEEEYVELLESTLSGLGHQVEPLEMSRPGDEIVDDLMRIGPELVFNMAEGTAPGKRESYYPCIYEMLGIPYTGGGPALLRVGIDKRLTEKIFAVRGVRVPKGAALTRRHREIPEDLSYPAFLKPNAEGSSLGISGDNVAHDPVEAGQIADRLLEEFPAGVEIEEFIQGRELEVPMLEEWAGGLLEPVEYEVRAGEHNIMGREVKGADQPDRVVKTHCPARLDDEERREVMSMAAAAFRVMKTADFGRIDLRLDDRGRAYVIEINPLPGLRRDSPVVVSAEACGLSYEEVCGHILTSAVKRYGLERTGPRGTR